MITAYLAGTVATMIFCAVRTPNSDIRPTTLISVLWPISIIVIALILLLDVIGYDIDVVKGKKLFGVRKPLNPNVRGFAVTMFYAEVQIAKV